MTTCGGGGFLYFPQIPQHGIEILPPVPARQQRVDAEGANVPPQVSDPEREPRAGGQHAQAAGQARGDGRLLPGRLGGP